MMFAQANLEMELVIHRRSVLLEEEPMEEVVQVDLEFVASVSFQTLRTQFLEETVQPY